VWVEVEFGSEEVNHVDEVVGISVASVPSFGGLNLEVGIFEDRIGDSILEVADNTLPMMLKGFGDALQSLDLRLGSCLEPGFQALNGFGGIGHLPDQLQCLAQAISLRQLREQQQEFFEFLLFLRGEFTFVLENRIFMSLELGLVLMLFALPTACLVNGLIDLLHQMGFIKNNLRFLEQQAKAAARMRPGNSSRLDFAILCIQQARQARMQITGMLKKVQVLPDALAGVMHTTTVEEMSATLEI